jgi:hypothetical protein
LKGSIAVWNRHEQRLFLLLREFVWYRIGYFGLGGWVLAASCRRKEQCERNCKASGHAAWSLWLGVESEWESDSGGKRALPSGRVGGISAQFVSSFSGGRVIDSNLCVMLTKIEQSVDVSPRKGKPTATAAECASLKQIRDDGTVNLVSLTLLLLTPTVPASCIERHDTA